MRTCKMNTSRRILVQGLALGSVMGLCAQAGLADINSDTLTTYVPSAASTGQDIRPLATQRGVFIDGSTRSGSTQRWILGELPQGEGWNRNARLPSGLMLQTGAMTMTDVHLSLPAEIPWIVGVSYNSRQETSGAAHRDSDGLQGANWFQMSQPELVLHDSQTDSEDMVYIIYGADRFLEFSRLMFQGSGTDSYVGVNGTAGAVVYTSGSPDIWTYYDPSGKETAFFGSNTASNKADWQIWKITNAAGDVSFVGDATTASTAVTNGYQSDGYISTAYDSADRRYTYSYTSVAGSNVLTEVKAETKTGGTWASPTGVVEVGKVGYEYYVDADTYGQDRDLKLIEITTPMTDSGISVVRKKYFRYWEGTFDDTTNPGHVHGIQYMVDYEGTRAFDWSDSLFDEDFFTATETALKPYSSMYFEYNSSHQIDKAWFNGECGCSGASNGEYTFTYTSDDDFTPSAGYQSSWECRTVVAQPDGIYITQYFDETGSPLSRITTDADPAGSPVDMWAIRVVRDSSGFISEIHTPAANSTYTHDSLGNPNGALTSSTSVGLINLFDRNSTGQITVSKEKEGASGTVYFIADNFYDSTTLKRTVGTGDGATDVVRVVLDERLIYDTRVSTYSAPADTDMDVLIDYTAYTGANALMVKQVSTKPRKVSTANNGENADAISITYLRDDGSVAFTATPSGTFTYSESTNGRVTKRIVDAQSNHASDFDLDPNTQWGITESGDGAHLITTITYGGHGRSEEMTLPSGWVTKRYYSRLADHRLVTISIPRTTTDPTTYYGPASYTVTNHVGKAVFSGTISLSGGSTATALTSWIDETDDDPITALDTGSLFRVSASVYNETGGTLEESRSFFDIPATYPGTEGTNYDATTFGYDDMGRRWRIKDAPGTITRTVYDDLGRVIETHIGTNDNGFTGGEASGTDDTVKVSSVEYDSGLDGGNSLVTKRTAYVEDSDTGKRDTAFVNDYRGRVIVVKNPQAPHTLSGYDDKNRVTASASYSSHSGLAIGDDPDTESTSRLSLSKTSYDERGQVWKTERYKINQSTGAKVQEAASDVRIVSLSWFDSSGRTIKSIGQTINKTFYDRLGRTTHNFVIATVNDTTYADAADVSGDIVMTESQTKYEDSTGNVLATATISRLHTDHALGTTTGALDTNADGDDLLWTAANLKGRIQITSMWYDELDRLEDTVRYGTNGGSNFDRDALAVSIRSDSALRTTSVFNDNGTLQTTEDPKGIKTKILYDDAGRQTHVVSNYTDYAETNATIGGGANDDEDIVIRYTYTNGLRATMVADMPSTQSDQTTTYTYGVIKGASAGDSEFANASLLQKVQYPDSSGGTDVVSFAYNAQGQQIWTKDQAGNIIETDFDTGSRQTARKVTTLAGGFNGDVRRIATTYTNRSQIDEIVSYDAATAGNEVNGTKNTYDEWGQTTKFEQDKDSAVGTGTPYDVAYTYDEATEYDSGGDPKGFRHLRRTGITLPNADSVTYTYNTNPASQFNQYDGEVNRVTQISHSGTAVATYEYLGLSRVVDTDLPEADVYSRVHDGSATASYDKLDNFGRITTSSWTWDLTTDQDLYGVNITWDRNSGITRVEDTIYDRHSVDYTNDDLGRMIDADRGLLSAGAITKNNFNDTFTLGHTGQWAAHLLDLNGDADQTDSGELDENNPLITSAHFNAANELTARDTNNDGTDDYTLTYDATGNLTDDGQNYEYVYDAFGRLIQVKDQSSVLVAEYAYNGLGHRISWHYDVDADADVDVNDATFYWVYSDRWQLVATYREADADPKETFVYHAGGLAGRGGSSYIDLVILRDDHIAAWDAAADATLERRVYYCQNWRADVIALLADNGRVLERVWYEPYGTPHGSPAADWTLSNTSANDDFGVLDGDADANDQSYFTTLYNASSARADLTGSTVSTNFNFGRPDGSVGFIDNTYYANLKNAAENLTRGVLSGSASASSLRNRKALAGYEWDPSTSKYHVRNRVLDPETGRWTRRDPLGYVDGASLYALTGSAVISRIDILGFAADDIGIGSDRLQITCSRNCPDHVCDDLKTLLILRSSLRRFVDCHKRRYPGRRPHLFITCRNCSDGGGNEVPLDPPNRYEIKLCSDQNQRWRQEGLLHELQHIGQKCEQGPRFYRNCDDSICAELEGWAAQDCFLPPNRRPAISSWCSQSCNTVVPGKCNMSLSQCMARCQNIANNCGGGKYTPGGPPITRPCPGDGVSATS